MLKVAYQGAPGAYSHIACQQLFPNQEYVPCDTFEIAMEMVKNGSVDKAVIPVENSNAGRVTDVHFLLPKAGLHIVGEHFLRVEHQLIGVKGSRLEDIVCAASHPQALAQCSEFLQKHNIKALSRIDTAKSCEKIAQEQDKTKAAIASKLAAEIYGLQILASNIENADNNTTRFLIMQKVQKREDLRLLLQVQEWQHIFRECVRQYFQCLLLVSRCIRHPSEDVILCIPSYRCRQESRLLQ